MGDLEAARVKVVATLDDSGVSSGLSKLKSELHSFDQQASQSISKGLGSGISGAFSSRAGWAGVGKELGGDLVQGISSQFGALGNVAGSAAVALGPVGIAALAGTAAIAGIGIASTQAAMEWDAGMSRISKTTGIERGTQQFKDLSGQLKDLYATMPTSVSEIQNVAAAAGSLGIESASIADFTKTALMMGSAFEIPADQAAVSLGRIKSQLKTLPDEAKDSAQFAVHFGSAVDQLGNRYNATESQILDFSTRTAGALSTMGAGAYDVAGWGAMLSSVFLSAELAAGSFNSMLDNLTSTTTTGQNAREKAAEMLGVTADEFNRLLNSDPSETILRVVEGLEKLPKEERASAAGLIGGSYGKDTLIT